MIIDCDKRQVMVWKVENLKKLENLKNLKDRRSEAEVMLISLGRRH